MLTNPRTPVIVGFLGTLLYAGFLTRSSPMPGQLSTPHARIADIATLGSCVSCHTEEGLTAGCLGCHSEIGTQLDGETGFHHYLLSGRTTTCDGCHREHLGGDFPLVSSLSWGDHNATAFGHPHVRFALEGKHTTLRCEDCHETNEASPFTLPGYPALVRESTFLGLSQTCLECHEDIHAGGLSGDCASCHGQESFRPATLFDHSEHFPLDGGHEGGDCGGCHLLPTPSLAQDSQVAPQELQLLPFDRVRGTLCLDCHESPHVAAFAESCETCHPGNEPLWRGAVATFSRRNHAVTGFLLEEPHQELECDKCHAPELPYDTRYPDREGAGYARQQDSCEGCHQDIHAGQFTGRYDRCVDCHDTTRFLPSTYTSEQHSAAFALEGAHVAVPCVRCHTLPPDGGVRAFSGTAHECKVCHQDPHAGQFSRELASGDCDACHRADSETFSIRSFDHASLTGYVLSGAHARASCENCHLPDVRSVLGPGTVAARRYRGTSQECSACHVDVHRGQFQDSDGLVECSHCHASTATWSAAGFEHNRDSRFVLDGYHVSVACSGCHLSSALEDGSKAIRYKPLGQECKDCHEVVPERSAKKIR